jgi:hypothetical protein
MAYLGGGTSDGKPVAGIRLCAPVDRTRNQLFFADLDRRFCLARYIRILLA